jgi:hypothetical protein
MSSSSAPDPILLTLFANRFMSVAQAMGKSLRYRMLFPQWQKLLVGSASFALPSYYWGRIKSNTERRKSIYQRLPTD